MFQSYKRTKLVTNQQKDSSLNYGVARDANTTPGLATTAAVSDERFNAAVGRTIGQSEARFATRDLAVGCI